MSEAEVEEWFRSGAAHERAGRLVEARSAYLRVIAAMPGHLKALNNLGTLHGDAGDHAEAEACYRQAIDAHPRAPEPWINLGNSLIVQDRRSEAREAFLCALAVRPDAREAHWNLALLDLADGYYVSGWDHYRFRPTANRDGTAPRLAEGALQIVAEQGLGDQLFFLRFIPRLMEMGIQVELAMDRRIAAMAARALPEASATASDKLSVADLPYLLRAIDCPPSLRLTPLAERVAEVSDVLSTAGPRPYVGLTWRAGERATGALYKAIAPEALGGALRGLDATFVDLQRAPESGEHAALEGALGRSVLDLSARNADLEDMLALMSLLDEYVGVSNTNMHLRAGAGRSARVLVAHPPEYRWMADGASPWFPGFALYRETYPGGWEPALAQLRADMVQ
jgi:hypothetical protein